MKRDTGRVYRVFLLIACIAVCVVGCAPPIGSIGGSATDDIFWTVPNRVAYDINDLFYRNSDLQVFTSYRGVVESIPLVQVKIGIAEDPDYQPDEVIYIPVGENYGLKNKGRKLVVVEYDNMSASYSIDVRDPFGLGGTGTGSEGGSGIEIEWETPITVKP